MIFKVAVLQMRSISREFEMNTSVVIEKMEEARRNNADILLLPECFITGYDLSIGNDSALTQDDLISVCEKAKELQIGVVATAIAQGQDKPQNAAFVIDKNGECVDNTLLLADEETEGLFYAEFDMEKLRCYREHEMMGNTFRKVRAYAALLDGRVEYPFVRE